MRSFAPIFCALLVVPLAGSASATPAGWASSVSTSAIWDSNVTNSDRSTDVVGAIELLASAATSHRVALGGADTFFIGAELGVESFPRFDGLERASLGPQLAWQHKFGLGPMAPIFRLELGASGVAARESARTGFSGQTAISWRQRIDEQTAFTVAYERTRHDAREAVFARTGGEASLVISREVAESWRLTLSSFWREGDVVSYAVPPRADLVALARVRTTVATFGQPRVAYSIDARTLGGSVAISRTLDEKSVLTLGYGYRRSQHHALAYVNHLVSAAWVRQF